MRKFKELITPPNLVSLFRLAGIPITWTFVIYEKSVWAGVAILILFVSDALDGYLARKLNMVTKLGARLDSLSDNMLILSTVVWLLLLRPEIASGKNIIIFGGSVLTIVGSISVMYLKFRRFPPNLHLYSAKFSAVVGTVFVSYTLIFRFEPVFFYITGSIFILSNLEEILLGLTQKKVNENMGSIFRRRMN